MLAGGVSMAAGPDGTSVVFDDDFESDTLSAGEYDLRSCGSTSWYVASGAVHVTTGTCEFRPNRPIAGEMAGIVLETEFMNHRGRNPHMWFQWLDADGDILSKIGVFEAGNYVHLDARGSSAYTMAVDLDHTVEYRVRLDIQPGATTATITDPSGARVVDETLVNDLTPEDFADGGTLNPTWRSGAFKIDAIRAWKHLDSDGDRVVDSRDAFPHDANETTDSDGDGTGDNGDAFPQDPNETTDSDGDGMGDNADPDDDNDGIPDDAEAVVPQPCAEGICVDDALRAIVALLP